MVLEAFKRKLAGIYRRSIIEPQLLSALEREKLLERDWYLQENPDVAASKVSAGLHFIRFGILEGRLPNRYFDAKNVAEQIENSSPKLARLLRENLGSFPSSYRNVTLNDHSLFSIYEQLQYPKVDVVRAINQRYLNVHVSIIVPVYNAFLETRECLESILRAETPNTSVFVINDASSEAGFGRLASEYESDKFIFLENTQNLGFSGTINKGINYARNLRPDGDILILNSDTIVSRWWLKELKLVAMSNDEVGTVTAVSNAAGPFSVHTFSSPPSLSEINVVADVLRENAPLVSPPLPTGHGFCMYIKGELIDDIGVFDSHSFPKGYGEENDFCMRAVKKGWKNTFAARSFVYHKQNASFKEQKAKLISIGREKVDSLHPEYSELLDRTFNANAYKSFTLYLDSVIQVNATTSQPLPKILYVISTETGGTPQTNLDLMKQVSEKYECYLLVSNSKTVKLFVLQENNLKLIQLHELHEKIHPSTHVSAEYDAVVSNWIGVLNISLLHIRHIGWHSFGLIEYSHNYGTPIVFSFHDFYTVCPTVKLLDGDKQYCGGVCSKTNNPCVPELWPAKQLSNLNDFEVYSWQRRFRKYLSYISSFVTTSESTKEVLSNVYPMISPDTFHVIPHGRDFIEFTQLAKYPEKNKKFRLVCPGNINIAKGLAFINELAEVASDILEIHIVGKVSNEVRLSSKLILHGEYERDQLKDIIANIEPSFGGVFSIWPETWCHTVTELLSCGVPLFTFGMGAIEERVRSGNFGWILRSNKPIDLASKLSDTSFSIEWEDKVFNVLKWQNGEGLTLTSHNMASQYLNIYKNLI
ncbi:glycosyltransferase [Alteromonas sp. MmMcT2-5]|uniref:glycosyltransferase n=1 Tax=Alteromonas sp. MmMcT2-5 TaxID=2917733 RepID=UPI0014475847|nr:glycosyltransferase [Alteromonas sp. MmMcT2-5]MCG7651709.1 glycosyltransferase [Alteromonas sp. MmMcT2-5]NKX32697.1 glycosyltransferase [Alteromonadaceae bacterium A_SAG1]